MCACDVIVYLHTMYNIIMYVHLETMYIDLVLVSSIGGLFPPENQGIRALNIGS